MGDFMHAITGSYDKVWSVAEALPWVALAVAGGLLFYTAASSLLRMPPKYRDPHGIS